MVLGSDFPAAEAASLTLEANFDATSRGERRRAFAGQACEFARVGCQNACALGTAQRFGTFSERE